MSVDFNVFKVKKARVLMKPDGKVVKKILTKY